MKKRDSQSPPPRTRRRYSAEEKMRILRLHVVEGQPISVICDQQQIHPTMYYQWQRTFFENGASAFQSAPSHNSDLYLQKIQQLEDRLKKKDAIIATVTEELVRTKRADWRSRKRSWTPSDERDAIVDFIKRMNDLTSIPLQSLLRWFDFNPRKFSRWRERYGKANQHNSQTS